MVLTGTYCYCWIFVLRVTILLETGEAHLSRIPSSTVSSGVVLFVTVTRFLFLTFFARLIIPTELICVDSPVSARKMSNLAQHSLISNNTDKSCLA